MNSIACLTLVALVLAGSITASHKDQPSVNPDENIRPLLPISTGSLFKLPEDDLNNVISFLPSARDLVPLQQTGHYGYNLIAERILSARLTEIMLNSNVENAISGLTELREEFLNKQAYPRKKLLFPSCLNSLTYGQRQTCLKNLFAVATMYPKLVGEEWIILPLSDLVFSAKNKWNFLIKALKELGYTGQLDTFVENQRTRLLGEIHLNEKWQLQALYFLTDLRMRIQHQKNGGSRAEKAREAKQAEKAVQDAMSATLCYGVDTAMKPTAASSTGAIDYHKFFDFLRNQDLSGSAWKAAARNAVMHTGQSISYNPFAGVQKYYQLKPDLATIILGVRASLPPSSLENAIEGLDSLFSFNQKHSAIDVTKPHDVWSRQSEAQQKDFFLTAIKFILLGLRPPQDFLQSSNKEISAEMVTVLLSGLVQYWVLESIERRQGTDMAQKAFQHRLDRNKFVSKAADFTELKRMVAEMTPMIVS